MLPALLVALALSAPAPPDPPTPGITPTGVDSFAIDQAVLGPTIDVADVMVQMRIVPHFVAHTIAGAKVVGMRPGALLRALGMNSGDIIRDVDGETARFIGDISTLVENLVRRVKGDARPLHVTVERQGVTHLLTFTFTPGP